jgi:hypothetical protein
LVFLVCLPAAAARAGDWKPVPAEELQLKDSPTHPGAHAIILYREEYSDDTAAYTRYHQRIKILTEEGRKYANIELPFIKQLSRIHDLEARTVRSDGTWIEFKGEVFEKTVVKGKGIKFLAKTFTLPEAQVGSIIEFKYRQQWDTTLFPDLVWFLQSELPTLRAVFQRKRYTGMAMQWVHYRTPPDVAAAHDPKTDLIKVELRNVSPFVEEEFTPPSGEITMRVTFYYVNTLKSQDEYWRDVGKASYQYFEDFIGRHGDIIREVAAVAPPSDPPETRLRKLYARAQKIRNLSYERSKTEKEEKREKWKENNNAKDMLKNGYGTAGDVTLFFAALARAAGFDTSVVRLSGRHRYFFDPSVQDYRQLNDIAVVVKLDGKELYLDPGNRFAPFGLLSWSQTGVRGLKPLKEGAEFILSPQPDSSLAVIERTAEMKVLEDGTLEGNLVVQFHGQAALSRRLDAYDEDDAGRKKEIEDEIKSWLPAGATVDIKNIADWEGSEQPLRIECALTIPAFATSTGRRMLVPPAVFHAGRSHPFQHTRRVHPVYFLYPYREVDAITLELPEGFQLEGAPPPRNEQSNFALFKTASSTDSGKLKFQRLFALEGFLFRTEYYGMLRSFYDRMRTADEERLVFRSPD